MAENGQLCDFSTFNSTEEKIGEHYIINVMINKLQEIIDE